MCIVSLVWDAVPGLLLFLAFNRDEALARSVFRPRDYLLP